MPMTVILQMSPMLPEESVAFTVVKVGDNSNDPLCKRLIGEQSWTVVWKKLDNLLTIGGFS
jgi:hypothetical protein